jgi:hypothetical protein
MESLGGDARWLDRFLARHSAICKAGGRKGGRAGFSSYRRPSRRVGIELLTLHPSIPPLLPSVLLPVYYWVLNLLFFVSPRLAYNFSELIESHAVDTYTQFLDENEGLLKKLPVPRVGKEGGREGQACVSFCVCARARVCVFVFV